MAAAHPQQVFYVAGASGTGTSTRAAQLHRELSGDAMAAARGCCVIATDVVRAQLRVLLERIEYPDLWGESFNLPELPGDRMRDDVNVDAFARQAAPILRAVEAGVEYALTEGWHVVVEGVHLIPGAFALPEEGDAEATVELLTVADPLEHVDRFRSRDAASDGRRPAAHYEANLARVRAIQDELVERWLAWREQASVEVTLVGPDAPLSS